MLPVKTGIITIFITTRNICMAAKEDLTTVFCLSAVEVKGLMGTGTTCGAQSNMERKGWLGKAKGMEASGQNQHPAVAIMSHHGSIYTFHINIIGYMKRLRGPGSTSYAALTRFSAVLQSVFLYIPELDSIPSPRREKVRNFMRRTSNKPWHRLIPP
jgi:hypothetical protein